VLGPSRLQCVPLQLDPSKLDVSMFGTELVGVWGFGVGPESEPLGLTWAGVFGVLE
jgi:hypothetical protein